MGETRGAVARRAGRAAAAVARAVALVVTAAEAGALRPVARLAEMQLPVTAERLAIPVVELAVVLRAAARVAVRGAPRAAARAAARAADQVGMAAAARVAIPAGRVETGVAALLAAPAVAVAARAAAANPGPVDRLRSPAVVLPPVALAVSASLAGRSECCQSSGCWGPSPAFAGEDRRVPAEGPG